MTLDCIKYKGKNYTTRDVWLSEYKVSVKVSTEDLDAVIFDPDSGYDSREAELIDELIFTYVPEDLIAAPDEELEQYITENLKWI